jgi:phage tail-like protein
VASKTKNKSIDEVVKRGRYLPDARRSGVGGALGDFRHLQTVVEVQHPVQDARTYLKRNLSNPVGIKLVEAERGEVVGRVRAIEVIPERGEDWVLVDAVMTLADGSVAGPLARRDETVRTARLVTPAGRKPRTLGRNDKLLLHVPVNSYLRYLPAVFRGGVSASITQGHTEADSSGDMEWINEAPTEPKKNESVDALRRFLFVFQHMMTGVVDQIDSLSMLTDPVMSDPKFLPWIASWVSFILDQSLPVHQQRELIRRAIRLYRTRGTTSGMEEIVRVLTSAPARIVSRARPNPFIVGGSHIGGGRNISERYHEEDSAGYFLYTESRPDTAFFTLELERKERFKQRFSERAPEVLKRISQVVTQEKPAHTTFTIIFDES